MADPLSVASSIVGLISLSAQVAKALAALQNYRLEYKRARFSSVYTRWFTRYLDTSNLQTLHWDINCWKDDEVKAWKDNCISGYGAVAVAASIFATVGLSGLQLPEMAGTHWSARALMSSSMALGILSLVCATSLYRQVSRLQSPLQIRLWLSRGKSKRRYPPPFNMFPLESSMSALEISEVPGTLLNMAVVLYLIGFGLYLLFAWLHNVTGIGSDDRNVFIFYISTVGLFSAYYLYFSVARDLDASRTASDFDLTPSEDFVKPRSQKELELMLTALQAVQKLSNDREDQEELRNLQKASKALRVVLQEMQRSQENERQDDARQQSPKAGGGGTSTILRWIPKNLALLKSDNGLESQRSPVDEERLTSLTSALDAMSRVDGEESTETPQG